MKRESFVFYRSFAEAVKNMDKETKADFLDALCAYALDGEETDCEGIVAAEGDVVIDPVAGSGATLRAARNIKRDSYGFECNRQFFVRAVKEMLAEDYDLFSFEEVR